MMDWRVCDEGLRCLPHHMFQGSSRTSYGDTPAPFAVTNIGEIQLPNIELVLSDLLLPMHSCRLQNMGKIQD